MLYGLHLNCKMPYGTNLTQQHQNDRSDLLSNTGWSKEPDGSG